MLVSTFLFSTADAADNTYSRKKIRLYVMGWVIVIIVIAIFACQVYSSINKAKAAPGGLGKLSRKPTSGGSEWTGLSDHRSDRTGSSLHRSDKTGRSDHRSSKTGRSDHRSDKTNRSDPRPDKSGRSRSRTDKTSHKRHHSSHQSKKSVERRSNRKEKRPLTRSLSSGGKKEPSH